MAYDSRASNSPSQPGCINKEHNPWQNQNTNKQFSGYYGGVTYQEAPMPPSLDPVLQETDDGWSEWPEDWSVEDPDECISNGVSNGFNQSTYPQQNQITTTEPQLQNPGLFFDQYSAPSQPITKQPYNTIESTQPKLESSPANSYFDNVQLNNTNISKPGKTAHLFDQNSMATSQNQTSEVGFMHFDSEPSEAPTDSGSLRTGISYAAALSGKVDSNVKTSVEEDSSSCFDDINLNDNQDTGSQAMANEENFVQPEFLMPMASFSTFRPPMPEKNERSASHLFLKPTVSTPHEDFFGSAVECPVKSSSAFGVQGPPLNKAGQQLNDKDQPNVEDSFLLSYPTPAPEEQSKEGITGPQSEKKDDVQDDFKPEKTSTEQRPVKVSQNNLFESTYDPSSQIANAFGVGDQKIVQNIPHEEDPFTSSQPSLANDEQRLQEKPLQECEEANVLPIDLEGKRQFFNQRPVETSKDNFFGSAPSQKSNPFGVSDQQIVKKLSDEEDPFDSSQPSLTNKEQGLSEKPLKQVEDTNDILNDLEGERQFFNQGAVEASQNNFFQSGPSQIASAFVVGHQQIVQNIPNKEDPFASSQPPLSIEEQRFPELPLQQGEETNGIPNDFEAERQFYNHGPVEISKDDFFGNAEDPQSVIADALVVDDQQTVQRVPHEEDPLAFSQSSVANEEKSPQELPLHQGEEASDIQNDFEGERPFLNQEPVGKSHDHVFGSAKDHPSQITNAFDVGDQTVPNKNSLAFGYHSTFPSQDQRLPEMPVQQDEEANDIQEHFDSERSFHDGQVETTIAGDALQDTHTKAMVSGEMSNQMAWPHDGGSVNMESESVSCNDPPGEHLNPSAGEALKETQGNEIPFGDVFNQMAYEEQEAKQGAQFNQTSEMVRVKGVSESPKLGGAEVSLGTSEFDSSLSNDTSSSSEQSQIEAAAWREEEKEPQTLPVAVDKKEVFQGQSIHEHNQTALLTCFAPPAPMGTAKTEKEIQRKGMPKNNSPFPPAAHFATQASMMNEEIESGDITQQNQPIPPANNITTPAPMGSAKMNEEVQVKVIPQQNQPIPPATHFTQPAFMGTAKVNEEIQSGVNTQQNQPIPPTTHFTQPAPMGTAKVNEEIQSGVITQRNQPIPLTTHFTQPAFMGTAKVNEEIQSGVITQKNQPIPPATHFTQPAFMGIAKVNEEIQSGVNTQKNQPIPPTTHFTQPAPMGTAKVNEEIQSRVNTQQNQPIPLTTHFTQPAQPAFMGTAKVDEEIQSRVMPQHNQPIPPPSNIAPPPTTPYANGTTYQKNEDVKKRAVYGYNQTVQSQNIVPPPQQQQQTFAKNNSEVGSTKRTIHKHNHPEAPANTLPPVQMFVKEKAGNVVENVKPVKTSTPEPPLLPETGPMSMTKRPARQEKSRTPVSLSSSLWSNPGATAMSPSIILAPALQQSTVPAVPLLSSEALQPKQELNNIPQPLPSEETAADGSVPLSKKERKAEKKRLKALKKEQKKLKKEAPPSEESLPVQTTPTAAPDQVQSSIHSYSPKPPVDSNPYTQFVGNPVGNPQTQGGRQELIQPATRETEYCHDNIVRGNEFVRGEKEYGSLHGGERRTNYGNPKESIQLPSRESSYNHENVRSDEFGIKHQEFGNPHGSEQRTLYRDSKEHLFEETREHKDRWAVRDEQDSYSHPKVQELRDSPSRLPQRQSEHLPHRDHSHRTDEHDPYEHHSGRYTSRTNHDELPERNIASRGSYLHRYEHPDDLRHSAPREHDDQYGPRYTSEYDDRRDRDYRYSADRREADRYRNNSSYDHFKRGRTRADDFDYYGTRRSNEDLSHLDRSYDGHHDHRRPERSSREELEFYHSRTSYHRDSSDRRGFKPINDPHYLEYKEPYRSNTPSSSSGRSSPAVYNYHHDPYYGYHPQHPYPGYEHHYAYYNQGPYGPFHYPGYYPGYGPYYDYYNQYGQFGSGHGSQYSSEEASFQDNNQGNEQQEESGLEKDQQEGEVQEIAPMRTTPLHFLRPHMRCGFGAGGQLLVTLPHHPDDGQKPLVEISKLKAIFSVKEREQIEAFPGPLSCRGTMKRQVIEFVQAKTDEIQQSSIDITSQQARWVMWKFMLSLVKHNGAIVGEDIAEILMMSVNLFEKKSKKKRHYSEDSGSSDSSSDNSSSGESSSESSADEASHEEGASKPVDHLLVFRGLLLEGKTKEAIEYAMKNGLWGHAVLLGGLMDNKGSTSMLDSKTSSSIISRFFETLDQEDPLKTVYEHLGGKVPHAVRRHTNWACHLAAMIANPTPFPDKDKENIATLGDTLAKHSDLLCAAHLCYLLAGLKPGSPGTNSKMVLVGCEHKSKKCDKIGSIEALHLTELFEYASSLENPEYYSPSLQMFRYFHAVNLVDAGMHQEALSYLQCVGDLMIKHPHAFNETMKKNIHKTTEQLVGHMEKSGTSVELFVLSWLKRFNNMMEGKDSGISLPKQDSESGEEEDPMAQSSMSYLSGEHSNTHDETTSPESTSYTHNTVSRQASIQSTHSIPSVHSVQKFDLSQSLPNDIYQPSEPVQHKESFSSQSYQDQDDGAMVPDYQPNQPTERIDAWQQQQQQQPQQQFGNDMWMPDAPQQQNSWMPSAPDQNGGKVSPVEDGEMTPVNAPTFEDFYRQANPLSSRETNWEIENGKTPTPAIPDSSQANNESTTTSESKEMEEKSVKKTSENNKNNSGQSSGFWNGITGLVKTFIPLGPKEVHLPDDKNKTIYFDKELNKWVNTEESEEDKAPPPPPPSDAMIGGMSGPPAFGPRPGGQPMFRGESQSPMAGTPQGTMPPNPRMPAPGTMHTHAEDVPGNQRGGPSSPTGPTTQPSLPGLLPGMQNPGKPTGPPSKFSRKAQGRLGSRNKYVDVLNPNKGPQQSSQAVPSALFPVMPTGGGSFQGTFFVPSATPKDSDADNSPSQPPTGIQSGPDEVQPPSPTHSRSSSLGSQSTVSLASAEVRSYFEGQVQEGQQSQQSQPAPPTFFDPSNFQAQSPSTSRRGRGRYPGAYNK